MVHEPLLAVKGGHAPAAGSRARLAVPLVLAVTSSEDSLHRGKGGPRGGDDVAVRVEGHSGAFEEVRVRLVADCEEEARGVDLGDFARDEVLDINRAEKLVAKALNTNRVPVQLDLSIGSDPGGHRLRCAEDVAADNHVDNTAVFGKMKCFLTGTVATAHNDNLLVAEDGQRAIAHSTGRHAPLPVLVGAGNVKLLCSGACRNNERLREDGRLALLVLAPQLERPRREVHLRDGLGLNPRTELGALLPETIGQVHPLDPLGEAGEVLNFRRRRQLAPGRYASGHHPLVEHRLQPGARAVHSSGVPRRPAPHNDSLQNSGHKLIFFFFLCSTLLSCCCWINRK